jgi:hypothetical protein
MFNANIAARATPAQMLLHAPTIRSAAGRGEFAGQQRRYQFLDFRLWAGTILFRFRR